MTRKKRSFDLEDYMSCLEDEFHNALMSRVFQDIRSGRIPPDQAAKAEQWAKEGFLEDDE